MAVIAINWWVFAGIIGAGAALTVLFGYLAARAGQRAGQSHRRAVPATGSTTPAHTPRVSAAPAASDAPGARRAA
jgi:hypothetical protein